MTLGPPVDHPPERFWRVVCIVAIAGVVLALVTAIGYVPYKEWSGDRNAKRDIRREAGLTERRLRVAAADGSLTDKEVSTAIEQVDGGFVAHVLSHTRGETVGVTAVYTASWGSLLLGGVARKCFQFMVILRAASNSEVRATEIGCPGSSHT